MSATSTFLLILFAIVFLATAAVTLLGICKKLDVDKGFLKLFSGALLAEVAGAMIWAFYAQDFTSDAQKVYNRVEKLNIEVPGGKDSHTPDEKITYLLSQHNRVSDIQKRNDDISVLVSNFSEMNTTIRDDLSLTTKNSMKSVKDLEDITTRLEMLNLKPGENLTKPSQVLDALFSRPDLKNSIMDDLNTKYNFYDTARNLLLAGVP